MNQFANWRALVPSWKFFDVIGPGFLMEYRFGTTDQALGDWHHGRPPQIRKPWNLFFNPQQNLIHALDSLVARIVVESRDFDQDKQNELEDSVTYQLILNWARHAVHEQTLRVDEFKVQFRICVQESAHHSPEEILVSLVHDV